MNSWYHPPDLHYSFKSNFSWPNPPPVGEAAGSASAAAAAGPAAAHPPPPPGGPRGYHTHGHGFARGPYPYWRPRFGFFKRAVWFGLGVGAASWYIHHKQEKQDRIAHHPWCYTSPRPSVQSEPLRQPPLQQATAPTPIVPVDTPTPVPTPTPFVVSEAPRWGWAARHERKKQRKEEAAAQKKEAQEIKEAVERAWAEQKQKAAEAQVQASDKAKEYAREKLDTLSRAVDKLREALDDDAAKGKKLV